MDACVCDVVGLSGSSDFRCRVAQYVMYRCASLSVGDGVEGHEAGSSIYEEMERFCVRRGSVLMKLAVNDMYRSDTGSVMPNPPSLAGRRILKYAAVGVPSAS